MSFNTPTLRGAQAEQLMTTAIEARSQFIDLVSDAPQFHENGCVDAGPMYMGKPTRRAHVQLAGRASVPIGFYDRIRENHSGLWTHTMSELYPTGPSLFRLRNVDGEGPILGPTIRAVLSDRYQVIDNVDVLTSMLGAFVDSGLAQNEVTIDGDFDADDGLLRIRCTVPTIGVAAHELVKNYRSPWDKRPGNELPMVFAGIEVSNSETGGGAFNISPRAVVQVCNNGMTRSIDKFRRVHLGSRLDQSGVISWSDETRRKQLELISSAAKDAITTFISPEYLRTIISEAEAAAGIEISNVEASVAKVVKQAQLSDDEATRMMRAFVSSADTSVLGLAHAVTAAAQLCDESDRQSEMEREFWNIVDRAPEYA